MVRFTPVDIASRSDCSLRVVAPASIELSQVSSFAEQVFSGQLSLRGATPTDPGTVDAAPSAGGQFLYVQTRGSGTVDEFQVGPGGSLVAVGSVIVPGALGGEGIVAF
jgi:hypothetical protein